MKLEIDWLKANCQMVHYFGLGFIQLKLDQHHRLHFYTDVLTPITSKEDIHNHRYDFTSQILKGQLIQEVYEVISGDTHLLEDESCQVDIKAECIPKPCSIKISGIHTYGVGSEYFISHETFHCVSHHGNCITSLTRTDYKKEFAQVIRVKGSEKVCPFSKIVEEKELWAIIEEMIR